MHGGAWRGDAGQGEVKQGEVKQGKVNQMNVCIVCTEFNRGNSTKFAAIDLASRDIASYVSNNYAHIDRCEAVYVYNADGRINFDVAACIGYAIAKKKVIFSFLPIGLSAIEVPVCDPDELTNQVILDEFVKNRIGDES